MTGVTLLLLGLILCLVVQRFAQSASTPRPFTARDLHEFERLSDLRAAPDGRSVVFTVRRTDFDQNKGVNDLWLVNVDGSGSRRLTTHPSGSHHPRWAPDGRSLFFLSARSETSQVWRLPLDGGEAEQVTRLPLDVSAFAVSPDGRTLALSLEVFPSATPSETHQQLEEQKKRKATGQTFDQLFFRHWDTWKDGRRAHLFAFPLAGGEPIDLMRGLHADCPSKPFGGAEEFTFTPDGSAVVFALRNAGREEAWSTRFDLDLAPADGSAAPRVLVDNGGAILTHPLFSPDGRWLAYLAMQRPGYESDRLRIMLKAWPDGAPRALTETWDRSATKLAWSADGRTLLAAADQLGQHPLFSIDAASGTVRELVSTGKVTEFAACGSTVVYGVCDFSHPTELFALDQAQTVRQLTHCNDARLADLSFGEPEAFTFTGWNNETVHGWIVKPVDLDPRKKYPVAFLIHGGPQGSFGNEFHYRWNPQCWAGAGYAVVMIDFHGSTGYGQAFTDAIRQHWGDRPFEDLQKGLAAALARCPWMDELRVAALGGSYGGYMVNWLHGVWPGRFRCLVCHDGNIDERMAYYDTEELWFPEWERSGPPWEKPDEYVQHNPIDYVRNWQTPTLVIHGGKDYRVVDAQGLSTFTALQRRGVPSRLLYFPDENHWVLKPHNGIQWYDEVIAWLDRWCRDAR